MGAGLIFYILTLTVIVVIGILISIGFLIAALIKQNSKYLIRALIPILVTVSICVFLTGIFCWIEERGKINFDNIEMVTIDNEDEEHSITILNEGSGSMGSFSEFFILDDGIVAKTEDVEKDFNNLKKFGYRFSAINEGQTVIAILEQDCGRWNYADFYTITVDENLEIVLEKTEHLEIDEGQTPEEVIPKEYSFVSDSL